MLPAANNANPVRVPLASARDVLAICAHAAGCICRSCETRHSSFLRCVAQLRPLSHIEVTTATDCLQKQRATHALVAQFSRPERLLVVAENCRHAGGSESQPNVRSSTSSCSWNDPRLSTTLRAYADSCKRKKALGKKSLLPRKGWLPRAH